MAGLSDRHDRTFPNSASPSPASRRERLERHLADRVRAMGGLRLTVMSGVERAAYELVDELRMDGLHCEHTLLVLKEIVKRSTANPHVVIGELVPLCIAHYYKSRP
jgi:hypothetical protein